jgi:hypothetical protein
MKYKELKQKAQPLSKEALKAHRQQLEALLQAKAQQHRQQNHLQQIRHLKKEHKLKNQYNLQLPPINNNNNEQVAGEGKGEGGGITVGVGTSDKNTTIQETETATGKENEKGEGTTETETETAKHSPLKPKDKWKLQEQLSKYEHIQEILQEQKKQRRHQLHQMIGNKQHQQHQSKLLNGENEKEEESKNNKSPKSSPKKTTTTTTTATVNTTHSTSTNPKRKKLAMNLSIVSLDGQNIPSVNTAEEHAHQVGFAEEDEEVVSGIDSSPTKYSKLHHKGGLQNHHLHHLFSSQQRQQEDGKAGKIHHASNKKRKGTPYKGKKPANGNNEGDENNQVDKETAFLNDLDHFQNILQLNTIGRDGGGRDDSGRMISSEFDSPKAAHSYSLANEGQKFEVQIIDMSNLESMNSYNNNKDIGHIKDAIKVTYDCPQDWLQRMRSND